MSALSPVLRSCVGDRVTFWCPGCNEAHVIRARPGGANANGFWGWDGNVDAPTFEPSILVTYNGDDAGRDGAPPAICHSFVRAGQIRFLGDCTHALAGQTVPLPPFPGDEA